MLRKNCCSAILSFKQVHSYIIFCFFQPIISPGKTIWLSLEPEDEFYRWGVHCNSQDFPIKKVSSLEKHIILSPQNGIGEIRIGFRTYKEIPFPIPGLVFLNFWDNSMRFIHVQFSHIHMFIYQQIRSNQPKFEVTRLRLYPKFRIWILLPVPSEILHIPSMIWMYHITSTI